jgi:phage baseplate assembly protein W
MATYIDFSKIENNELTELTDVQAINNSLKNIFSTPLGSLPGKPKFGTRINQLIFSQMDYATEITLMEMVREEVLRYEPRIILDSINIRFLPEYNSIAIEIKYYFSANGTIKDGAVSVSVSAN